MSLDPIWFERAKLVKDPLAKKLLLVSWAFIVPDAERGARFALLQNGLGCSREELEAAYEDLERAGFVEIRSLQ